MMLLEPEYETLVKQIKELADFLISRNDVKNGGAVDNAIRVIQEQDARLKWWLENYDITLPCGHKNRYEATDTDGTKFCVMCESESLFEYLKTTVEVLEAIKDAREKKREEL